MGGHGESEHQGFMPEAEHCTWTQWIANIGIITLVFVCYNGGFIQKLINSTYIPTFDLDHHAITCFYVHVRSSKSK